MIIMIIMIMIYDIYMMYYKRLQESLESRVFQELLGGSKGDVVRGCSKPREGPELFSAVSCAGPEATHKGLKGLYTTCRASL